MVPLTIHIAIVVLILFLIVLCYTLVTCSCEYPKVNKFANRSSHGYTFDVIERRIVSKTDRTIAEQALLKELAETGSTMTLSDLSKLSDSMIVNILESDNDSFKIQLMALAPIAISDDYKTALRYVALATRNKFRLKNESERELVFNVLSKYFASLGTPIDTPLIELSDMILITSLKTLVHPSKVVIKQSGVVKRT